MADPIPIQSRSSRPGPAPVVAASVHADAAAQLHQWRDIGAALTPVIGNVGVAALFRRSLFLRGAQACLAPAEGAANAASDELGALWAAARARASDRAEGMPADLLPTFVGLLDELLGSALTGRLIGFALAPAPSDSTLQDNSP